MFKIGWIIKKGTLNIHHGTIAGLMKISRKLMYLFLIFCIGK